MKTTDEWSLEFDLLYNNISSDKAPGLEDYEKSVFLTRAQESVVIALYKGTLMEPFEATEDVTVYLGALVKQASCSPATAGEIAVAYKISPSSVLYKNPSDMLFRTWEGATITVTNCGSTDVPVIPITQDEYWRAVKNPFRKANSRKVLRLSYTIDEEAADEESYDNTIYSELISESPITAYNVRYLARPTPIILSNLSEGLSINGESDAMTCKLDEALHQTILVEAVRMAKAVWNT